MEERKPVTPKQIRDRMDDPDEMSAQDLFNLMPPEIKARFVSGKGNPKEKDLKKFIKSLDLLMDDYTVGELLQMSEECIDREGGIYEEELKKILADEEGI